MSDDKPPNAGAPSPFAGRLGSGFASLRAKAGELGSNVATSVNDMNSKVVDAAKNKQIEKGGSSVANASREELVEVLQKMNKKVKALSAIRTQLTAKVQSAEQDRDKLIILFKEVVLEGMDISSLDAEPPSIQQLHELWRKKDQQHQEQLESLRSQMQSLQTNVSTSDGGGQPSGAASADTTALREQLRQEHERAMAAMKATLATQHTEDISKLKQNSASTETTTPSTPAGDNNTSEIEGMKTQHVEEMKKLKHAAALQMQNFKKKVTAARAAELDKIKKETRDQVELELKSTIPTEPSSDDIAKIKAGLQQNHAEQLQKVREEMQAQAAKDSEMQINKILSTMNMQGKEHEEELERLRHAADKEVQQAQSKIKSLENVADDSAAQLDAVQNQVKALQTQYQSDLEEVKKGLEKKTAVREKLLKEELSIKAKDQALADSKGLCREQDEALNKLRSELASQFEAEMAKLQVKQKAELERTRSDATKATTDMIAQTTSAADVEKTSLLFTHQQEIEERLSGLRRDLQMASEKEIAAIKSEAQSGQSDEMNVLREKFAGQAKDFQKSADAKQAAAVEKATREAQESLKKALGVKAAESDSVIRAKAQEHEAAITKLEEEHSKKVAEALERASSAQSSAQEMAAQAKATEGQIEKLKSEHQSAIESLKVDFEAQAEVRIAEANAAVLKKEEHKLQSKLESLKMVSGEEMKSNQAELQTGFEAAQKIAKDTHLAELEDLRKALAEEGMKQIKAAKATVSSTQEESETKLSQVRTELEKDKNSAIEKVKQQASAELDKLSSEAKAESEHEMKLVRSDYDQKLEAMQESIVKTSAELRLAQERGQTLDGKVEELTSRLSQLADEKEAILAAAKDGEEVKNNVVEESLAKQRASFEKMLSEQKARQEEEVKTLQASLTQLDSVREETTKICQQLAARENEVITVKAELDDANMKYEQQVALSDEAQSKMQALESAQEDLQKALQHREVALEAGKDEAAKMQKSINDLRSASSEAQKSIAQEATEARNLMFSVQEKLSTAEVTMKIMKVEHESMRVNLQEREVILKAKEAENIQLKEEIENLRVKVEDAQASSGQVATEVRDQLSVAHEKFLAANKSIETMRSEHEVSLKDLHEFSKNLEDQRASASRDKEASETANQALSNNLQKMEEILSSKEAEIADLTKQTDELGTGSQEKESKLKLETAEAQNQVLTLQDKVSTAMQNIQAMRTDHDVAIQAIKADHGVAIKVLRESIQSSASDTLESQVEALEKSLAEKDQEVSAARSKFDEQITEIMNKQSALQLEKGEFENRVKQMGTTHASEVKKKEEELQSLMNEIQQKHVEAITKLREEHAASLGKLEEEVDAQAGTVESRVKAELDRKSEEHAEAIEELKSTMANHVDKMKAQFIGKLNTEREKLKTTQEEAEEKGKERETKITKFVTQLKGVSEAAKKEREEKLNLQQSMKIEIVEREKLSRELVDQKKILEEAKISAASSLAKEQADLNKAKTALESELKALKEDRSSKANKVEELAGKLEALTNNLNAMAQDIKNKDEALQLAKSHKVKLDSSENEVTDLRQQINKLKLELTKNSQLANRLQGEKESSERNHGQRTALMGMLEGQLAEVNENNANSNAKLEAALYDLSQKDEVLNSLEDKLKQTQAALTGVNRQKKEASDSLAQTQKGAAKKGAMMVESLQRELQQLQQSTARKSSAAQKLIQEREVECTTLRGANKKLQQEVDKGSLSDRKIFELAELQSNRESAQLTEIEVRDKAIERLKEALLDRDGDLASAENTVQEVEGQVEELGRVKRREDVNVDYLKSIVVQFLSKAPGTSERAALLPVLATLLQFDAQDYNVIEEGKKKVSWWGTVEPVMIGGTAANPDSVTSAFSDVASYLGGTTTSSASKLPISPPPAASAEVSISNMDAKPTTGARGRNTSLQF